MKIRWASMDTPVGPVAVAWNDATIVAIHMEETEDRKGWTDAYRDIRPEERLAADVSARFGDVEQFVERVGLLVRDADLRARMGAAGVQIARERFDVRAVARRYEVVYRTVLKAHRKRSPRGVTLPTGRDRKGGKGGSYQQGTTGQGRTGPVRRSPAWQ